MSIEIIKTNKAPAAIGAYSQATKSQNLIFLSGQIGLNPDKMELVSDNITEQTHQIIKNLISVLEASGASLNKIVKVTVYLTDLKNYATVNEIMLEYFKDFLPARALVEVAGLPKNSLVEIEAIAIDN